MSFETITEILWDWRKKQRLDAMEVFGLIKKGLKIQKKDQKLEAFESFCEKGLGIRVLNCRSCGFSYTTKLSPEEVCKTAEQALEIAHVMEEDQNFSFPKASEYPTCKIPLSQELRLEDGLNIIERAEKAAFEYDPRVRRLQEVSIRYSSTGVWVANTFDLRLSITIPIFSVVVVVVAEENGRAQIGWEWQACVSLDKILPEAIAKEAAKRAVVRLNAKVIPSTKIAVLLPPHIAVDFLKLLSFSVSGDQALKGKSFLAGKIGQKVFSSLITIIDDGLFPEGLETRPFDDEGTPQQTKALIVEGVLERFLFDVYWGNKSGRGSTGNARRQDFKNIPTVCLTNFFIKSGTNTHEDLVSGAKRVFEVLEILGMHTADPVSGDFSIGVSGLIHEGGQHYPITGMALSGNIFDIFNRVEGIGDDLRFYGRLGSPSILLGEMDLSGA